jgi:hypothetical protein
MRHECGAQLAAAKLVAIVLRFVFAWRFVFVPAISAEVHVPSLLEKNCGDAQPWIARRANHRVRRIILWYLI